MIVVVIIIVIVVVVVVVMMMMTMMIIIIIEILPNGNAAFSLCHPFLFHVHYGKFTDFQSIKTHF